MMHQLSAQTTEKEYTLTQIFSTSEEKHQVKFAYDPEIIRLVDTTIPYSDNIDTLVRAIEETLPFKITLVDKGYNAVSLTTSTYRISVVDSTSLAPLAPETIIISQNSVAIETKKMNEHILVQLKPSVSDTLVAYVFGYKKQTISLNELVNSKNIVVLLVSPTIRLSELVIEDFLTKGINMDPSDQKISIKTADLPLLPGETDGDIFASISALPGLTTPDNRAGNLYIRGSDTDQSLILFDNIPIYHRGHYYGMISPYNPKMVDHVDVYRSGFHPRMGDRVGGAVVIDSDQKFTAPEFGIGTNTLFATAYAKVPIKKKFGVSIGARHSLPDQYQSAKLKAISEAAFAGTGQVDQNGNLTGDVEVLFEDYHTRLNFTPNKKNSLSISGIYTNTNIKLTNNLSDTVKSIPELNSFQNIGANLSWQLSLPNQWKSTLSATFSKYDYKYLIMRDLIDPENNFYAINELQDLNFREEISGRVNNRIAFQVGVDFKNQETFLKYRNAKVLANEIITQNVSQHSISISPYVNGDFDLTEKLFAQVGIRATYFDKLAKLNISPRLSLNYDVFQWMTMKSSFGMYQQYLSHVKHLEFGSGGLDSELWTLADNNIGHVMEGIQAMVGTIIHHNQWILDIEGYYKNSDNITIYEGQRLTDQAELHTYDQKLYGIDFFLKNQLSKEVSIWTNYSFSGSSIVIDTAQNIEYESKYVQPHAFGVGGSFIKNNWKVSGSFKVSSGLNAQSIDIIYVEGIYEKAMAKRPPNAPKPPNPFDGRPERYDPVQTLDISCSYIIPKTDDRNWQATFGLSLLNVLNKKNLVDQVFRNSTPPGFTDRHSIGFAPNLMVMFEF
jgi:hypothetical protein